jgi:hypothetical protein
VPQPGSSWRLQGRPATQPHEYVRGGTCKILTLFHPTTGQVHLQPVSSCTNVVLHGWLKERLEVILATLPAPAAPPDAAVTRAAWQTWQAGLAEHFTLPAELPPLRLLLVWDNLAGHKSAEMVVWLCQHGIMPLYTPLGGSWLNMAESIQRILKRRTLDGQHQRAPPRSAPGSSRPPRPGTGNPHLSSGTASADRGDASNVATHTHSAARAPIPGSRSQRAATTHRNGTDRGR